MPEPTDREPDADEPGDRDGRSRAARPAERPSTRPISASNATRFPRPEPSGSAATADRVGTIVAAAERMAETMRLQAESRMRDRIAEGERAAQNRVRAAEEEAAEILKAARSDAEQAKTVAASEALAILAKAHDDADRTRGEAEAMKTAATAEVREIVARARQEAQASIATAKAQSREILGAARVATASVHSEGTELVSNLREMGDSLRSNAERLLRDVQAIHSRMVAQLDRVDGGATRIPASRVSERDAGARRRAREAGPADPDELSVPEFIPPG